MDIFKGALKQCAHSWDIPYIWRSFLEYIYCNSKTIFLVPCVYVNCFVNFTPLDFIPLCSFFFSWFYIPYKKWSPWRLRRHHKALASTPTRLTLRESKRHESLMDLYLCCASELENDWHPQTVHLHSTRLIWSLWCYFQRGIDWRKQSPC